MSVKLMSAIFETEFFDLPYQKDGEERRAKASTCKLLLLAIADHANDYGESSYPGYERLTKKTALSRQGIADTLDALEQNGILQISERESRLHTNNYTIKLSAFPCLDVQDPKAIESSRLTTPGQATLQTFVKPLDLNHQLTTNITTNGGKPPIGPSTLPIDWQMLGDKPVVLPDERLARQKDAAALVGMGMGVLAEPAAALVLAFQVARGVVFTESQIKGQRKAAKALIEQKITPTLVTAAVKKLQAAGMTVTDLYSITKTAIDLANKTETPKAGRSLPEIG